MFKVSKKFIKKARVVIERHYVCFLISIVLISYGQMLGMYVWQDDNALFFKLAHINEPAGYFAPGPIGIGLTKYSVLPFIPVHYLFGFNTIFYFGFLLILYLIATICVYKAFSLVLGEMGGRIAGFIFAAGYVASDGIWRMANSATTSLSIIFTSLLLLSYWKFYKGKKIFWYLSAVLLFFLASEVTVVRTHYLIAVVIALELLFLTFKSFPKSILFSAVRLIPVIYIFDNWVLGASASRTSGARDFVFGFLEGNFHLYYGFLSSLSNLIFSDWLTRYFFIAQRWTDALLQTHVPLLRLVLVALPVLTAWLLLQRHPRKKVLLPGVVLISVFWVLVSKDLFATVLVQPTLEQYFVAALGGILLLIAAVVFMTLGKDRRLFLLLFFWMLVNLAIYSAYNPTFQYSTAERYVAHSFLPLVGIFGLLFVCLPRRHTLGKIGKIAIILLGVGNLFNAVMYQNTILHTRSFPAKSFYKQLKVLLPTIKKGDILYFDVSYESQRYYNDAVATAMMPETTAFAWRYGVDRYDIKLITDFPTLLKTMEMEETPPENVHAFWYSDETLIDKTNTIRDFFSRQPSSETVLAAAREKSEVELSLLQDQTFWAQPDLEIALREPLDSTLPIEIALELSAVPASGNLVYPLVRKNTSSSAGSQEFANNLVSRRRAIEYKRAKQEILSASQFRVSSEWQNNVVGNLHDGDINSVWQSERTGWGREFTFIEVKLPYLQKIERAVWINGFSSNTPADYDIEVSLDGQNWEVVAKVKKLQKIDNREPQVITFPSVSARYVRMVLRETLNGDSPVVAEFWAVPAQFLELDINLTEKFLEDPLAFVPNKIAFLDSLAGLRYKGLAQLVWDSNKKDGWESTKQSEFEIFYDGVSRIYKVTIPAGGTENRRFKLSNISIPGTIFLHSVTARHPKLEELVNN